jgi:hypothetical protein
MEDQMRNLGIALLGCLSAFISVSVASADDTKSKAELKWARKVATDFLEAVNNGEAAAVGFLSPELSKGMKAEEVFQLFWASDAKILSEHVAPNGCEVIFAGVLPGFTYEGTKSLPDKDFPLRVAKENGGRWNVRFIRVTERQVKKKTAK